MLSRFPGFAPLPSDKISFNLEMSMEHWWNDTDRRKTEVLGENLVAATLWRGTGERGVGGDEEDDVLKATTFIITAGGRKIQCSEDL
jgi:hypothetical protein